MISYLFNVEKVVKNQSLFVQSLNDISSKKQIVYQSKIFDTQSLFIFLWFEIDQIVHAWLNIAVT